MPENSISDRNVIKEITGQIERITYNDEESGYSVLRMAVSGFSDLITAVGTVVSPVVGASLDLTGTWQNHPKFGMQFRFDTCRSLPPSSIAGIEKYLGSGLIKGVGPSMAEKIVSSFGADTFDILDNCPEKLLEIEGIGNKKAAAICMSWSEQREIRDIMFFLQEYGIGASYAIRVFRYYGNESVRVLKENPYRLAIDILGIGFLTADKIAAKLGFSKDSPLRIRAGVLHVMNELIRDGNIYVPIEDLASAAAEILSVSQSMAEKGIEEARLAEDFIAEWYQDEAGNDDCAVYIPAFHYAEVNSARNLLNLISAPFNGHYIDPDTAVPWV